jgi:hypothetical protein
MFPSAGQFLDEQSNSMAKPMFDFYMGTAE